MTIVIDAAPLVAVADRRDRLRPEIELLLRDEPGELVIPAPVTAEVDYLLGHRLGRDSRLAFLDDLAAGRFTVAYMEPADYGVVRDLERRYEDLDVGLADLSVVVAAGRYGTRRLLTFDERHFRALRPLDGGHFTLLPADELHRGLSGGGASQPSTGKLTGLPIGHVGRVITTDEVRSLEDDDS